MEDNNQFLQQFGGSATANLLTAMLFMVYKFIEGRCKHSSCQSNTRFCKCKTDNYDTERATSNPYNKDDVRPVESLQGVQARNSPEIQTRHPPIIEVREPESRENSGNFILADKGELV